MSLPLQVRSRWGGGIGLYVRIINSGENWIRQKAFNFSFEIIISGSKFLKKSIIIILRSGADFTCMYFEGGG